MKWEYELPWPPTANSYYRNIVISGRPRTLISAKGRDYRKAVIGCVTRPERIVGDVEVRLDLYPPDRRRRDIDNVQKPILDALTKAGVWGDDVQVAKLTTERFTNGTPATVRVTITTRDPS